MATDDSDSGVETRVPRVLSRGQVRLRRDLQQLDERLRDGPVLFVAIVEQHGGRWSDLFPPVEGLAEASTTSGGVPPDDAVLGFAAVRAWRFVRGPVAAQQQQLMDAIARRRRRCRAVAFLEYPFIATATLKPRRVPLPSGWARLHPDRLSRTILQLCEGLVVQATMGTALWIGQADVRRLLQEWPVAEQFCHVWPVTPRLAAMIVAGEWAADVSDVVARNSDPVTVHQLVFLPPRRALRACLEAHTRGTLAAGGLPPQPSGGLPPGPSPPAPSGTSGSLLPGPSGLLPGPSGGLPPDGGVRKRARDRGGSVRQYHWHHLLGALRCSRHLRALRHGYEQASDVLSFLYPAQSEDMQRSLQDDAFEHPSHSTLLRAKARLDVCAMLAQREWYRSVGECFRYVAFDASPQRGVEVFNSVERVVPLSALQNSTAEEVQEEHLRLRRLPLVCLGQGKAALEDKTQAHLHQTTLEYGSSIASLRRALSSVRQCLSDMGTEFGIADAGDILPAVVRQLSSTESGLAVPVAACSRLEWQPAPFLFPLALQVPGTQHIIDLIVRDVLAQAWWPQWEAQAKEVCQFLRSQSAWSTSCFASV